MCVQGRRDVSDSAALFSLIFFLEGDTGTGCKEGGIPSYWNHAGALRIHMIGRVTPNRSVLLTGRSEFWRRG